MNYWILLFAILSIGINGLNYRELKTYNPPRSPFYSGINFEDSDLKKLHESIIFGKKSHQKNRIREAFKKLNINHLQTPSCLHLSSLLLLISFFWKRKRFIRIFIPFFLFVLLLRVPELYSLKRACLFIGICSLQWPKKLEKNKSIISFLTVFLIDYFWMNYRESPLSFWFSLCFLSIFIFSHPLNGQFFKKIFITQLSFAFIFYQPVNILALVFGHFVTATFTFIFPLAVLNELGRFIFLPNFIEWIWSFFLKLILVLFRVSCYFPQFLLSIPLLLFFFCLLNRRWNWTPLLLLLHSPPLVNQSLNRLLVKLPQKQRIQVENLEIKKIVVLKKSVKTTHPYMITCRSQIFPEFWDRSCRLPRVKAIY